MTEISKHGSPGWATNYMFMSAQVIGQMSEGTYWHLALLGNRPLSVLSNFVPRENLTDKQNPKKSQKNPRYFRFNQPTKIPGKNYFKDEVEQIKPAHFPFFLKSSQFNTTVEQFNLVILLSVEPKILSFPCTQSYSGGDPQCRLWKGIGFIFS